MVSLVLIWIHVVTLVGAMDKMLRGQKIADLVTTGAALDFVIPDIDR